MVAVFKTSKTFGHQLGLSVAFRQWRAGSHCRFVHGYALAIRLDFQSTNLDDRGWVVDFGDMKDLLKKIQDFFDHKTLVAEDDPELAWFKEAHQRQIVDLVVVPATSCEHFAFLVYQLAQSWLANKKLDNRCSVSLVEVSEHGANSASYAPLLPPTPTV
jgi:6-pyruvoyltetrahydropterin/6-carboxytetrahydropterin synthase